MRIFTSANEILTQIKKVNQLNEKFPNLIPVIIIGMAGFLSFTWFRGDFLVNPGDMGFSFNPTHDLYRALFAWDSQQGLGVHDSLSIARIFPYYLFMAVLQKLGFSLYLSQKLLFYIIFTVSGISAYLLISHLLAARPYRRVAALFGANFYMMNTYLLQLRWGSGYIMGMFLYAIFPFLVLMWLKGRRSGHIKYGIGMVFGCLFALPSLTNPALLAPLILVCLVDIVILLLLSKQRKIEFASVAKFCLQSGLLFMGVFSFWIFSVIATLQQSIANLAQSTSQFRQEVVSSSASSLLNLLRHLGDWGFFSGYRGQPYYSYSTIYNSFLFVIIGFIFVLTFFLPLLFMKRQNEETRRNILFFTVTLLVSVWLSKGVHEPLGIMFQWAIDTVTFFKSFRSAYEKFGTVQVLCSAVLCSYFLSFIADKASHRRSVSIAVLALFVMGNIYAFPFWNGDVFRREGPVMAGFRFKIPQAYYDLNAYLEMQGMAPYRLLQLPDNNVPVPGIITLNLEGELYGGSDPLSRLLKFPIVHIDSFNYSLADEVKNQLFEKRFETDPSLFLDNVKTIATLMNVKYILMRGDVSTVTYPQMTEPGTVRPLLGDLDVAGSFGSLTLYRLPDENIYPLIYPVSEPVFMHSPPRVDLLRMTATERKRPGSAFFFIGQNLKSYNDLHKQSMPLFNRVPPGAVVRQNNEIERPVEQSPVLEFRKINPTKYRVRVFGARDSFFIVFSELYHEQWKAYLGQTTGVEGGHVVAVESQPVPEGGKGAVFNEKLPTGSLFETLGLQSLSSHDHWIANGYANAWRIELAKVLESGKYRKRDDGSVDFEVILEFKLQRIVYLGIVVSFMSLGFCFVGLVRRFR